MQKPTEVSYEKSQQCLLLEGQELEGNIMLFGGQLPADSGTSLSMKAPNIQRIPSMFQILGSLAR